MKIVEVVANKTNKLLSERNWSIYKLSRKSGLTPNAIQSIINCKYSDVKLSSIILIAHAFEMTVSEFLNDDKFKFENLEFEKF